MELTNEQKQDLRKEVLAALVIRHPAALAPRQIGKAVKKELPFLFEDADVVATLEFLKDIKPAGFAISTKDELGSSDYWAATAAGVLFHERA